jgi:hypothetical protein
MQNPGKKQSKRKSKFDRDLELLKTILKSKQDIRNGNFIAHEEVKLRLGYNDKKSVS